MSDTPTFDQFTRWLCPVCNEHGIHSWNKAMHDGIDFEGVYPVPAIFGDECNYCGRPVTLAYFGRDEAPRAIVSPDDSYTYEPAAMAEFEANPAAGVELLPSIFRDRDWSAGCLSAKGQLQ